MTATTAYVLAQTSFYANVNVLRFETIEAANACVEGLPNEWTGHVFTETMFPGDMTSKALVAAHNAIKAPETAAVNKFATVKDGLRRVFNRMKEIAVMMQEHAHEAEPAAAAATTSAQPTSKKAAKKAAAAERKAQNAAARAATKEQRAKDKENKIAERAAAREAKKAAAQAEKDEAKSKRLAARAAREGAEKGYAGMRGQPLSETQKKILVLMERVRGVTILEVVEKTGLSMKSAENNVHRVRAKILPERDVKLTAFDEDRKAYKVVDPQPAE